jgi:formate hydrogenlyase subunit 3/multisubunit Na+/H+ antiporter MnhD subunit
MLSGIVIEAGLVALLRVLTMFSDSVPLWGVILLSASALNMLVGNLLALRQHQVKRMLAFSSISHVGYMLLGFGAAMLTGSTNGAAGGFFHLFNHALMKGLAFLSAGVLLYAIYLARGLHGPLVLDDLNGAARRFPLPALAFSIAVLALGGLPPLSGFMSKWQIFVAGFSGQNPALMILVIFAGLNSILSLGYYAPLVNRLYRNTLSPTVEQSCAVPSMFYIPLVILSIMVILLGFYPSLINYLTYPAAESFLFFLK